MTGELPQKAILVCPKCHSDLSQNADQLVCAGRECGQRYYIMDDIPVMIPGDADQIRKDILSAKQETSMFDRTILGIPLYRIDYNVKKWLYKLCGITLPKIEDQRGYWLNRGAVYCQEFLEKGYRDFEIFFQDIVVRELQKLKFDSIFEAGCGFGWNIKRFKKEFPQARVGGLDFSHTQLCNGKRSYLENDSLELTEGDATMMPFRDNAYDVGFSLGVFMNIHPKKIGLAIDEMKRVCSKYTVHLEYDENHAAADLRERRAFKTNIVSHDYRKLYEERGLRILTFLSAPDFAASYESFLQGKKEQVERWESWEGASKYILIIAEKI